MISELDYLDSVSSSVLEHFWESQSSNLKSFEVNEPLDENLSIYSYGFLTMASK